MTKFCLKRVLVASSFMLLWPAANAATLDGRTANSTAMTIAPSDRGSPGQTAEAIGKVAAKSAAAKEAAKRLAKSGYSNSARLAKFAAGRSLGVAGALLTPRTAEAPSITN